MAYLGLPRNKSARQRAKHNRKSPLYYAKRRALHLANGPTLPQYAPNTNVSAASLRGKWMRFCSASSLDPDDHLKNLSADSVKSWFDWIKEYFTGSIKSHDSLANYWRTLKRLYYMKNRKAMDSDMQRDCINYMDQVSKEMGLRRFPLPKPTADSLDLLQFLVTHLVHCDSVFADEKQRLYPLVGLNVSSISACRAVSLFDTRHAVNPRPDGTFLPSDEGKGAQDNSLLDEVSDASEYEASSNRDHLKEHTANDNNYDSDCVTDDGYFAGDEETGTILWRHIEFYIVHNPEGRYNLLTAIVTLIHTKGEDQKPRIKRFVIEHEDNLIFDLLSQLLALALDDDVFVATIRDVAHIYTVPLPKHRKCIQLKIKGDKLDLPIFREPENTEEGYQTSDRMPLKARTFARYIKRIGVKCGQKENLTQKVIRRGGINAINNQAPSSIRDQVADHESNAIKYYLNPIVNFDTAAAFHKRASNEVVQREMRTATLLADNTAPVRLTDEQSRKIKNDPRIRHLRIQCQELTSMIQQQGFTVQEAKAAGTELGRKKKEADAELNRTLTALRELTLKNSRKRHFRDADTEIFNRQYADTLPNQEIERQNCAPNHYLIKEREGAVRLLCYSQPPQTDEEAHLRRLEFIRLLVCWQRRKESPRRGMQGAAGRLSQPEWGTATWEPAPTLPEKYDPLQCPFCLSNPRLAPVDRQKKKSKTNKLWDHVEKIHRLELAAFESGTKHCGICGMRNIDYVPPSVTHFKNHTHRVHGIRLRS